MFILTVIACGCIGSVNIRLKGVKIMNIKGGSKPQKSKTTRAKPHPPLSDNSRARGSLGRLLGALGLDPRELQELAGP